MKNLGKGFGFWLAIQPFAIVMAMANGASGLGKLSCSCFSLARWPFCSFGFAFQQCETFVCATEAAPEAEAAAVEALKT